MYGRELAPRYEAQRGSGRRPDMISRREFILGVAAGVAVRPAAGQPRKKIAALSTTYHVRSHSDNFITRFLEGYWINDRYYPPPCDIVSLFTDQVHPHAI